MSKYVDDSGCPVFNGGIISCFFIDSLIEPEIFK